MIVQTREVDPHGRAYYIAVPFRKFSSVAEAFDKHAELLATAQVYESARRCLPDCRAFVNSLTGAYATDPNYGRVLWTIIEESGFQRYDNLST